MKVAIMQPYFFPYIGYFQLINAVDVFVMYDDVNYIKQGWINRNRILINNKEHYFTLQIKGGSSFRKIKDITIGNNRLKLLKTIEQSYKNASQFENVHLLITDILTSEEENLSKFLIYSLKKIAEYLGIKTVFMLSSEIDINTVAKAEDKIITICKKLGAINYINAIGGQELYNKTRFDENSLKLQFLKTNVIQYNQFNANFVPWLSIIDVLMFNDKRTISKYLEEYQF